MFVLVELQDIIQTHPATFGRKLVDVLLEEIDGKYCNRVLPDVGLCISLYDFLSIGDSKIYPGEEHLHTEVSFRMIVFRPSVGELLEAKLVKMDKHGLHLSMDFFSDITVPEHLLHGTAQFTVPDGERNGIWSWTFEEPAEDDPGAGEEEGKLAAAEDDEEGASTPFAYSIGDTVRFRVMGVEFEEPYNHAAALRRAGMGGEAQKAPTDKAAGKAPAAAASAGAAAAEATVAEEEEEEAIMRPPMQITGSVADSGLGSVQWWSSLPDFHSGGED